MKFHRHFVPTEEWQDSGPAGASLGSEENCHLLTSYRESCLTLCFFLTSSSFFAVLFFLQFVYPCPHCIQSVSSTSSQSFSRLPGFDPPAYPLPHSASKPFVLCSCLCLCTCLFSLTSTSLQYPFWVSALTEFNSMPSSRLVVPHDFMPHFLAQEHRDGIQ